jgi:hypothetical protein
MSSPSLVADSGKLPNLSHDDHQVFDEMRKSEFGHWRSPSRTLEIAIYKAWYPITESVLHQVFDRFGVVEGVYVREGLDCIEAHVLFQSKHQAAEAFSNFHGQNIYDGCCDMQIKWGLFQEAVDPEPRAHEPCPSLESPLLPPGDAPTALAPSTTTCKSNTITVAIPPTTSTPPGAPLPGLAAVSSKPANLFNGAQKMFEITSLRQMLENKLFRGFLGVRGRRIGKVSRSRSTCLSGTHLRHAVRDRCAHAGSSTRWGRI